MYNNQKKAIPSRKLLINTKNIICLFIQQEKESYPGRQIIFQIKT